MFVNYVCVALPAWSNSFIIHGNEWINNADETEQWCTTESEGTEIGILHLVESLLMLINNAYLL